MLAIDVGDNNKKIILSFLNSFIPEFQADPILDVSSMPIATPPLKKAQGDRQTFMDYHVISDTGKHFIVEMQSNLFVLQLQLHGAAPKTKRLLLRKRAREA